MSTNRSERLVFETRRDGRDGNPRAHLQSARTRTESRRVYTGSDIVQHGHGDRGIPESSPLLFKMQKCDVRLVRWILEQHGFRETEGSDWNILWMTSNLKPYMMQGLNKFQKINHFPRTYEITRKDKLHPNISKMCDKYGGRSFDFIPRTYTLPEEWNAYVDDVNRHPARLWIMKPAASSQGRGIHVVSHPREVGSDCHCVISHYVSNPLLIDGFKFDLRIYVLVTSYDPLRIYIFEEGFARFSTEKFSLDPRHYGNKFVHLTNYSINKKSHKFVPNTDADQDDCGNKWSLGAFKRRLHEMGVDVPTVMTNIQDLVIKTLIAVETHVVPGLKTFVPHRGNCFELLGFDVMIADNLKPWLIEVNLSPSLATDSPLDRRIKSRLIANMFNMVGVQQYDQRQLKVQENQLRATKRAQSAGRMRPASASSLAMGKTKELSEDSKEIIRETHEEFSRRGGFVRVFPTRNSRSYFQYFDPPRAHNAMLYDSIRDQDHSDDEKRWLAAAPKKNGKAAPIASPLVAGGEEEDEEEDVEMILDEETPRKRPPGIATGNVAASAAAADPGEVSEAACPPPENLYARKAVEEFLACVMERLKAAGPLLNKGQQGRRPHLQGAAADYAQAVNLVTVGESALSMLSGGERGPTDGQHYDDLEELVDELQDMLSCYVRQTDWLQGQQPPPIPAEQEQATVQLERFKMELMRASVEDLSRFLHRFVDEMPRAQSTKPPQVVYSESHIDPECDYPGAAAAMASGRAPYVRRPIKTDNAVREALSGLSSRSKGVSDGRPNHRPKDFGRAVGDAADDALRAHHSKAHPMVRMSSASSGPTRRRPSSAVVASSRAERVYEAESARGDPSRLEYKGGGEAARRARPHSAGIFEKKTVNSGAELQVSTSSYADRIRKTTPSGRAAAAAGQRKRAQSASRARPAGAAASRYY